MGNIAPNTQVYEYSLKLNYKSTQTFTIMRRVFLSLLLIFAVTAANAQKKDKKEAKEEGYIFTVVKENPITSIKDQNRSSTCWAFSTISFLESEIIKAGKADTTLNLSEMFVVSKAYSDKAEKYVRLDGALNFGPGSDFGDVLCVFKEYGAVPESVMNGLQYGEDAHVHSEFDAVTRAYVQTVIKNPNRKLSTAWKKGFEGIEAAYLGEIPETFTYEGKEYTPKSFAESLGIDVNDYVSITSFTHHPFYEKFVIEVPDNWRWTESYNVPIDELVEIMDNAIENGYTIAWGSDVSEKGFTRNGLGIVADAEANELSGSDQDRWVGVSKEDKEAAIYNLKAPGKEKEITQEMRQIGFDNKQTTDDHGMHIFGIAKDQNGTEYYMVKNSWGKTGDYDGIWYVSKPFVKYKTMNILVNKKAVPAEILNKLGIN